MSPVLLAAILTLTSLAPAQDVRSELAHLASDAGSERLDAERWLAVNLRAQDLPLVAETGLNANTEVRTRLTRALSSDDRHFELAVLLLTDREPALHRIGHDALGEMAVRWFGDGDLAPMPAAVVFMELKGRFIGTFSVRPYEHELDELVDMLARNAPTPASPTIEGQGLSIVLDPLLYAETLVKNAASNATPTSGGDIVLEGNFEVLLREVVRKRGARLDGFGFKGKHPWVRIAQFADVSSDSALDLIERWCVDVIQYPERPRGEGSARALAACGWPAPLEWLEKRWNSSEDRNALSGLLLAAGRGRVAPSLATAKSVETLLGAADERCSNAAPGARSFARQVANALSACPAVGSDGSDLSAAVMKTWAVAAEMELDVRVAIRAAHGRAPQAWRDELRVELSRANAELVDIERLVRLRALASTQPVGADDKPWPLAANESLLAKIEHDRAEPQFLGWIQRVSAMPPVEWSLPANVAKLSDARRLLVIEWWMVGRDGLDNAARLALDWIASGKPLVELGDMLAERVRIGDGARVERLIARAAELGGANRAVELERLALLAGVLAREPAEKLVTAMLANKPPRAEDLPLFGASAATELSVETTDALVGALLDAARRGASASTAAVDPWADACERASIGFYARGWSKPEERSPGDRYFPVGIFADPPTATVEPGQRLLSELEVILRQANHPLLKAINTGWWPRKPGARPISLEALEPLP